MAYIDDIVDAVLRKIGIAKYHLEQLRKEVARANDVIDAPLSVQAHLEGVLCAADAAVDKTGHVKKRLQVVRLSDGRSAYEHFDEWRNTPLLQHARTLRNEALHSAYFKRPSNGTWSVPEIPSTGYHGPYELEPYCDQIVATLKTLEKLIESAEEAV